MATIHLASYKYPTLTLNNPLNHQSRWMVDDFLFRLVPFAYSSNFLLLLAHSISFIYIFASNTINKQNKKAHKLFSTKASNIFISFWWDCVGKEKDLCFTNSTPSSLIQIHINFLWDVTYSKSLIYFTLLFLARPHQCI